MGQVFKGQLGDDIHPKQQTMKDDRHSQQSMGLNNGERQGEIPTSIWPLVSHNIHLSSIINEYDIVQYPGYKFHGKVEESTTKYGKKIYVI